MSKIAKIASLKFPRAVGKLERMLISAAFLKATFANLAYTFPGQRNHGKNQRKRTHTKGVLIGGSQQFVGVYIEELKQYFNIDGYHRAQAVIDNEASFPAGADIELTIHRVKTMKDAEALYDQFNSAVAAKKAICYFESGMRAAEIQLYNVWTTGRGIISGLQLAADVKGTVATKSAVVKLQTGLKICDEMQLPLTKHVSSGVKGALVAIAQYAQDKRLAMSFIAAVCADQHNPIKEDLKAVAIKTYVANLKSGKYGGSGGGAFATNAKFEACLGTFVKYAMYAQGRKRVSDVDYTIGEFIEKMNAMPAKAA